MSRPKKMHEPLKGGFNEILSIVAMGSGKSKKAVQALQAKTRTPAPHSAGAKKKTE